MAARKPALEGDLQALQGRWIIAALEMDGAAQPVYGAGIEIRGAGFSTWGMGEPYGGEVTLDAVARPRTLDLRWTSGPHRGRSALGIYRVDSIGLAALPDRDLGP